MVYYGDKKSIHYSEPPKTVCFLSRNSRFDELVMAVHAAMNTTPDDTKLTLLGRYPLRIPDGQVVNEPFPLTNNQSLEWFLKATWLFPPLHVYVAAEKITVDKKFVRGEPLLKRCSNGVSTSRNVIDLTSDDENEDKFNVGDDGRVRKISRLWKDNPSKASSSYREDERALNGGNAPTTATDTVVTTNPSPTATQAAPPATNAVPHTNPSPTATQAAASATNAAIATNPCHTYTQGAADATDAVGATNPSSAAAAATPAAAAFDFLVAGREDQTTTRLNHLPIRATVFATPGAPGEFEKKRWWTDILNSLTPKNSKRVLEQVKDANIDNAKSLVDFVRIAYDEAMRDHVFCEMLVDICVLLNSTLPGFTCGR
ncbi:unnamed protein product [Cuscuta campestris]|uniref:Uncharacterized protein n=1 Tax=Cuscuta campestris TaxID=132261 RepID=A0A484MA69_9ASTE|nr:unnamed protein product [Cuscuta campestris]